MHGADYAVRLSARPSVHHTPLSKRLSSSGSHTFWFLHMKRYGNIPTETP